MDNSLTKSKNDITYEKNKQNGEKYKYSENSKKFSIYDKHRWWVDALIYIGGTIVLGGVAKLLGGEFGFKNYKMPPATAPQKVFPFIWIAIYIAIGVSTFLMWRDKEIKRKDRRINLILFIIQMIFNIIWPLLFFRLDMPIVAVVWLVVMIGISCACMYRYFICNLPAGIIFNIYTLWLIYALYLNLGLVLINF